MAMRFTRAPLRQHRHAPYGSGRADLTTIEARHLCRCPQRHRNAAPGRHHHPRCADVPTGGDPLPGSWGLEIGSWNLGVEIWELAAGAGQGAVRSAVHRPSACASIFARPWPELPSSQPASDDGGRADHGGTSRTHVPIRLRRAAVSREGSDGRPMTVEWRRCCCATAP